MMRETLKEMLACTTIRAPHKTPNRSRGSEKAEKRGESDTSALLASSKPSAPPQELTYSGHTFTFRIGAGLSAYFFRGVPIWCQW